MPEFKLHYQVHSGKAGHGQLPLCELALIGPIRRVPINAVVDSGATHPMFPASAARDAGIDLSRALPTLVDFGGSATVGKLVRAYVEFVGLPDRRLCPDIIFIEEEMKLGYALLGRRGIFAQFAEIAFAEKIRPGQVIFRW
ncbi:MAG TPA: hypothetical protein VFW23_12765 [Tepidisphaeraceae bacterium]|nr:hypothetical protein [Tepidisphaeraceae bacterium]